MKGLLICLVVLGASLLPAPLLAHESFTVDGRFNTLCRPWIGDTSKRLCVVSFYKLIADPEKYQGNLVQFHGFMGKVFGQLMVFPSEDSFKNNVFIEAIALKPNQRGLILKGVSLQAPNGVPVMVTGEFDANYGGNGGTTTPLLGAVKGQVIVSAPARPH